MRALQRIYICVLRPFHYLTKDIPENVKDILIMASFSLIFIMEIFKQKSFFIHFVPEDNVCCEIGGCLLFIIIIMSVKGQLTTINHCNLLTYLWIICGAAIMAVSFIHPVGNGFRELSVLMALEFPWLYFVWGNRGDYNKLYSLMARAIAITGGIYFAVCAVFRPFYMACMTGKGYLGLTHNANFLGMVCVAVICTAMYMILINREKCAGYTVVCATAYMYLAMTASRTSLIAAFAAMGIFMVFYVKSAAGKKRGEGYGIMHPGRELARLTGIVILLLAGALSGPLVKDYCIMTYTGVSDTGLTQEESWRAVSAPAAEVPEGSPLPSVDQLNDLSSGRIFIWKEYIDKWNLLGHDADKRLFIESVGKRQWAHNTFLEVSYRTGIVNGLIFLAIEVLTVLYALKLIMRGGYREPYHFMVACTGIVFFVYANLEISVFPFYSPQVLLFYLSVAPLFFDAKTIGSIKKISV